LLSYEGGEACSETVLPDRRESASGRLEEQAAVPSSLGSARETLAGRAVHCSDSPRLMTSQLSPRAIAGLEVAVRIRGRRVASIPNLEKPRGLRPESSFNPRRDENV
jgi:hypothetical protein